MSGENTALLALVAELLEHADMVVRGRCDHRADGFCVLCGDDAGAAMTTAAKVLQKVAELSVPL